MNKCDRPLVTFALFAYNQEKYIQDAVVGAFAQDYSPLEIILSDDCSNDKTFEIIKGLAEGYVGPHSIILIKNEKNLGICKHVNNVLKIAKGCVVVMSAGDDISFPPRVRRTYECFENGGEKISALFSNLIIINEFGIPRGLVFNKIPEYARNIDSFKQGANCWVIGASFSFRRSVFKKYGDINPAILQEDGVLAFRSLLEGEIYYLNEPFVSYRHHDSNISQTDNPSRRLKLQKKEYLMYQSWLDDANNSGTNDYILINTLKKKNKIAKLRSALFSLPVLGYGYNSLRVGVRKLINNFRRK